MGYLCLSKKFSKLKTFKYYKFFNVCVPEEMEML